MFCFYILVVCSGGLFDSLCLVHSVFFFSLIHIFYCTSIYPSSIFGIFRILFHPLPFGYSLSWIFSHSSKKCTSLWCSIEICLHIEPFVGLCGRPTEHFSLATTKYTTHTNSHQIWCWHGKKNLWKIGKNKLRRQHDKTHKSRNFRCSSMHINFHLNWKVSYLNSTWKNASIIWIWEKINNTIIVCPLYQYLLYRNVIVGMVRLTFYCVCIWREEVWRTK